MAGLLESVRTFVPMMVAQQAGRQNLKRTPEPEAVTGAQANVTQYDQVMGTKLVLSYAAGLEAIHRIGSRTGGSALDLACGPGHFTICLARYLGYESVVGIDLAERMVAVGTANAEKLALQNRVRFATGDAMDLTNIAQASFDLVTFNNAAHHLPDLETVKKVICEMMRVARPSGLITLMDLVRLRTKELTERYVNTLGADYVDRGLPAFFEDFQHSMYAAWTAKELQSAIPTSSNRTWFQLVPRGLPTVQIILGLPEGRHNLFVRSGLPWTNASNPVPPEMRSEHSLLRKSLFLFGSHKRLNG
jgi:ubiquinone/menaquinone biosynthesis C-methylase UbiE